MSFIFSLFNLPIAEQDMFPSFDTMFSLFWIVFILVAVSIVVSVIFTFWRMIKAGRIQDRYAEAQPPVQEKEIIREVIKIRCPYCGNIYDQDQDKCPYCGAKR